MISKKKRLLVMGALLLAGLRTALLPSQAQDKPVYPAPAPVKDKSTLGLRIQRSMTLLATSTPQRRNKVRILFYGQSITEQNWSKRVADDLRRRFPHADLEIENRAIGGFASQRLIRPAEHDLYPFYPDLMIFHVYGGNNEYEQIIKNTRSRTTAEILMQTDHATRWPPEVIDEQKDKSAWWDNLMNQHILPDMAKKYGCGLVDVRAGWLEYLKANKLEPKALLSDDVHLNGHGNYLMAELVKRYLVYRPELPQDSWRDTVRTFTVGRDVKWKNNRLVLPFDGNRVDIIPSSLPQGATGAAARVLIDGKKPSDTPGLYRITRPTPGPWSPLTVTRVDHQSPLLREGWTLKITSVSPDSSRWNYDVIGSVTGPDGSGSSDAAFVSKSGRVKIEPDAFFRNGTVPVGYEIKWQALPMFVDAYEPPKSVEPARDNAVTLVQGLSNARHTLEIIADRNGGAPIQAIRIYRPPVK